jgi:hypothetical protein
VTDELLHRREELLEPGAVITPGRWGSLVVIDKGGDHPLFFREQLLELWRVAYTQVPVSRLNCTYAFEDRANADGMRAAEHLYRVVPQDPGAPSTRV